MSKIFGIKIGILNQEEYDELISYIEKAGTVNWQDSTDQPIYKIESIGDVSGNPLFYRNIKITIHPVEVENEGNDGKKIRKSLKGLIDLLN